MAAGRSTSNVTVVLGGQWGDEGKGKLVDLLATKVDYVCRCQVITYERNYQFGALLNCRIENLFYVHVSEITIVFWFANVLLRNI